ncbi:hypothetical protein TCELL_0722 [Thermogladius calderae 1633]|uniref:Uncharacterized protein n=1 Tax=Thermogladius calderae (strain DSM 22663 / VKM B-2946 / 1633) TaxID=1184251 RepID=I3TEF8_THEC1|nr:hypothetical protein TCELL_0722 [Thermogladius calderae 1633]
MDRILGIVEASGRALLVTPPLLLVEAERRVFEALRVVVERAGVRVRGVVIVVDDTVEETSKCIRVLCSTNKALDVFATCSVLELVDRVNQLASSMRAFQEAISKGAEELYDKYVEYARELDDVTGRITRYWVESPDTVDEVIRFSQSPELYVVCDSTVLTGLISSRYFASSKSVRVVLVSEIAGGTHADYSVRTQVVLEKLGVDGDLVVVTDESKLIALGALTHRYTTVVC